MVAWIFAGGTIEETVVKSYKKEHKADFIIAVDSGLSVLDRFCLLPTHLVGDFDSVESDILRKYEKEKSVVIRRFQPEKDFTDSQIAVELALTLGCKKIVMFGATGSRIDHLFGNLQLLYTSWQKGAVCEIYDANNKIYLLESGKDYQIKKNTRYGKYFSFLPFTDKVCGITLTGFKYPLNEFTMTRFENPTLGISNELIEEVGNISFLEGMVLCIESKD